MPVASLRLRALLAGFLVLIGCEDSSDRHGSPDAGGTPAEEVWDGSYVPLQERTDWVDPGPLAPCSVTASVGATVSCDAPGLFDLSGCPLGALDSVEPHGIYQSTLRTGEGARLYAGIWVPPDGGTGKLNDRALTRQQLDHGFLVNTEYRMRNGSVRQYALAGCAVPEAGRVTGCFARCLNGKVTDTGTFDAARMTWGRGESESSGGLHLVSESRVELGTPVDVYVTHGHAYVVSITEPGGPAGGLTVFDVSDPRHPVFRSSESLPGDTFWNGVWSSGDALYVASAASGVIVFDISNPASPAFVRSVPGGAPIDVHTLFVEGSRLYAMSPAPNAETLVFDITTPLSPTLLNRLKVDDPTGLGSPHDAFAYGDRLYVNHLYTGYVVLDVKDATQVRELGRYTFGDMTNLPISHANAVGTFAGRTIAFEGGEGPGTHVRVLDVTDPASIPLIGEYALRPQTSIHNMVLKGSRLYIAHYHEGLRVLDVSIPPRPRELAYFNTFRESDPRRSDSLLSGAMGVRVPGDGHVYVVDTSRGLLVFNEP